MDYLVYMSPFLVVNVTLWLLRLSQYRTLTHYSTKLIGGPSGFDYSSEWRLRLF
jgi:hypothetical protein